MNAHSNAKLTPLGRAELVKRIVELRQPVAEVAAGFGFGIAVGSAQKWLARFRADGTAVLRPVLLGQNAPRTASIVCGSSESWPCAAASSPASRSPAWPSSLNVEAQEVVHAETEARDGRLSPASVF